MPLKEMLANQIWVIYLAQFLVYFSLFGVRPPRHIISNMSEYFIRTRNASNKSSGAFFVMLTIGSVLGSVISGYSIKKTGKYKTLSVVGLLLMITAVVLFMVRWPQGPNAWEVSYLAIQGFGFMAFNAAFFVAVSVSVPRDSGASVITTYYLAQQLGILVGVNSTAAVVRSVFKNHLMENLALEPMANKACYFFRQEPFLLIIQNVLQDNRFAFKYLPPNLQEIIANTFMKVSFVPPC
ncbi:hypothetical protein N7450_008959 [Penicillium hetheringtonii]|uniref:Major facilitator superfamily (MFS) profile domain-containing protein n=1 Tax=Penicillium hetheringtonii TaxID=911720 RepID=A0AAD6DDX5_9EURO|nr:hypothetical protein N7450_008959 [Penicillium hetheringtonii]